MLPSTQKRETERELEDFQTTQITLWSFQLLLEYIIIPAPLLPAVYKKSPHLGGKTLLLH